MKYIKLTQGQVAAVDDEDFAYLTQFNWCAVWMRNRFYAVRGGMKSEGLMGTKVVSSVG